MSKYETRTTRLLVTPEGEPLFSETGTAVEICDEAAGEFIEVSQTLPGYGKIMIEVAEWPALRDAIEKMLAECRV